MAPEGDRRANFDILEANKNSNRDEIKRMREENKELRMKLTQLQRVRLRRPTSLADNPLCPDQASFFWCR